MYRIAVSITVIAATGCSVAAATEEARGYFDKVVAPVIAQHCLSCHSGSAPKGDLDISTAESLFRGGESGSPLVRGAPDDSLLWQRINAEEMPPEHPLKDTEKRLIRRWIESGAVWGANPIDPFQVSTDQRAGYDWWALQPSREPPLPAVRRMGWARNGIDYFVLAQLESQGMAPAPEADRRTLIRRLAFDLLGLPPTPEQVSTYLSDREPGAYRRLVDRLLASPDYGIRWARLWLDVARFGESQGFERDKLRENAWHYRDWVIDAINASMPYDEFVRLQIAGDILQPQHAPSIVATGFLVAGPYDEVGQNQQSAAMKAVVREDELEDIVSVVGQTFLGLTINCARCHDHKFDPIRQREYYQLTAALAGVRHGARKLPNEDTAYAVVPQPPGVQHVLLRGNPASRGKTVVPAGIGALVGVDANFELSLESGDADRRRRLAEWITNEENPLFARVIANRIWHYHFGQGLVPTPNDFGFNGGRPSHPALLDFLANAVRRSGWSLKTLHRLIVDSAAYRQSSKGRPSQKLVDAGNRWLWKKTPRRLEAEMLRDAILAASGQLNRRMGGPGYRDFETFTHNTQFYRMTDPVGPEFHRRSVYRTWIRSGRNRFLDVFDCPDPSTKTPRRAVTTTPLQALALLNNSFVLRMAGNMAEHLRAQVGTEESQQVDHAFEVAFSRPPDHEEAVDALRFVREHGLTEFCRVVFNSNEFLYVD